MNLTIVVVLVALIVLALALIFLLSAGGVLGGQKSKQAATVSTSLRSLVAAQRSQQAALGGEGSAARTSRENLALAAAADSQLSRKKLSAGSRMTLEKKMRYAQWKLTPLQFRAIQLFTTIMVFIPIRLHATIFLQILALVLTPQVVMGLLDKAVGQRFKAFDADYPVLLLSYVSLLKTGMTTIAGLEAAAKGLDEGSLVRSEVELLIERLRLGLTEEQAISAFGEDIAHPELELFVQSLLLSRKVGGTLSTTLERLAKQVRKRQQFRQQAVAVVGLERGSIYAIAGIMTLLMFYLTWASPELVMPAFRNEMGNKIFQAGIALIIFGFYWSRKVTNIKI
jgi:tight adherence protein B